MMYQKIIKSSYYGVGERIQTIASFLAAVAFVNKIKTWPALKKDPE
jgi:hypothetical protein